MDPQTNLPDLVEDLEVDIDELTTALEPLLSKPLHTTASSLPLLDKAKLYCLAAYAIESLLFASLTASGVNATEHAIFKEIARLRQYNSKIKEIEDRGIKGSAEGRARLDVAAAGRFIKHGLAGNDKYDLERQERMAKERARAHLKAQQINKKFDDEGRETANQGQAVTPKKRGADDEDVQEDEEQVDEISDSPATKKPRVEGDEEAAETPQQQPKKRGRPSKKDKTEASSTPTLRGSRRNKSRLSNQNTNTEDNDNENEEDGDGETQQEPDSAPKTRSETFTALLDGSHKQKKAKGKSGKKGGKGKGK